MSLCLSLSWNIYIYIYIYIHQFPLLSLFVPFHRTFQLFLSVYLFVSSHYLSVSFGITVSVSVCLSLFLFSFSISLPLFLFLSLSPLSPSLSLPLSLSLFIYLCRYHDWERVSLNLNCLREGEPAYIYLSISLFTCICSLNMYSFL